MSCEGHQKHKRERLCRYIARPAVAIPRLSLSSTGKDLYTLKTPYRDGTRACPALSGTQVAIDNTEVRSPVERHAAMRWAQRLKRVFNIDIETCGRCGGAVIVIACIGEQETIDRILSHLRDQEQGTPTLPHLAPPTRAPPAILPLFARANPQTQR